IMSTETNNLLPGDDELFAAIATSIRGVSDQLHARLTVIERDHARQRADEVEYRLEAEKRIAAIQQHYLELVAGFERRMSFLEGVAMASGLPASAIDQHRPNA